MAYDIPSWSFGVARSIMSMVRMKDAATYEHCVRVSRLSKSLAQAAGLNEYDQRIVEFAGLFHDIGKVGVPDSVLLKPDKLTNDEYESMKSHPVLSVEILKPLSEVEFYSLTIPGVLHHHERFDGRGYPHGVMGEDIPLISRIILVVDTYDAMTATRPYRRGLPVEVAYKELNDFAGRQFDPRLVKVFVESHSLWKSQDRKQFDEVNNLILPSAVQDPIAA